MASVHPEASDNLLEALRGASIDEEHHTIMSAVVEKVRSAKSGPTEACASLLTGFNQSVLGGPDLLNHRTHKSTVFIINGSAVKRFQQVIRFLWMDKGHRYRRLAILSEGLPA